MPRDLASWVFSISSQALRFGIDSTNPQSFIYHSLFHIGACEVQDRIYAMIRLCDSCELETSFPCRASSTPCDVDSKRVKID